MRSTSVEDVNNKTTKTMKKLKKIVSYIVAVCMLLLTIVPATWCMMWYMCGAWIINKLDNTDEDH